MWAWVWSFPMEHKDNDFLPHTPQQSLLPLHSLRRTPIYEWMFVSSVIPKFYAGSRSWCELMGATAMSAPSEASHNCPPNYPALPFFSSLLLQCSRRLWGGGIGGPPKAYHSTVTCSQHFDQPGVSALTTVCRTENLFWSRQRTELVCEYKHKYSAGNLRTCSFNKTGSGFTMTSWILSLSKSTVLGKNSVLWSSPHIQSEIIWLPL